MIQNLIFGILSLKILFCSYEDFIIVQTFQQILSEFFLISGFLTESLKANKNQQKKITHFTIQFYSKNFNHFTNLNSLDIENDTVCSLNVAKNLSDFTNFQQTCFFLVSEKNICTAPFLDAQELHFESKCLYISLYLLKKIFVPETQ